MSNVGLPELVSMVKDLEQKEIAAEQSGDVFPEEFYYQKEILSSLIAGKVDQAIEMKKTLEGRVESLKEALDRASTMVEKIEDAFKLTLKTTGQKRIDGLAWAARLQKNSRASTIVEDDKAIPEKFWNYTFSFAKRFSVLETQEYLFWASVVLRRPMTEESIANLSAEDKATLDGCLAKSYSKTDIETALKADPKAVPGARLEYGEHVRFVKGEARPKALADGASK